MKKTLKKVLNIIVDVVIIFILIISLLIVILSVSSEASGVPQIFGIAPLSVQSDSMEDTLKVNDLIFSEVTNSLSEEYKVGDIVSFYQSIDGEDRINTHRIVEVIKDENTNIVYYKTQGDNKKTNPVPDEVLQTSATIVAKYTGKKIGGIGVIFGFIRTQLGFFLCVLLPMILFFVYEAIRVVMNIIAYNKAKAIEQAEQAVANSELTEEQKQRAIEEYLAKQNNKAEENAQGGAPEVQTPAAEGADVPDDTAATAESSDGS